MPTADLSVKYPLQCYSCLRRGDYNTFGLPVQCPDCGSYEVHDAKPGTRIFTDPDCAFCLAHAHEDRKPPHESSRRCQSGGRTHCSCGTCF